MSKNINTSTGISSHNEFKIRYKQPEAKTIEQNNYCWHLTGKNIKKLETIPRGISLSIEYYCFYSFVCHSLILGGGIVLPKTEFMYKCRYFSASSNNILLFVLQFKLTKNFICLSDSICVCHMCMVWTMKHKNCTRGGAIKMTQTREK